MGITIVLSFPGAGYGEWELLELKEVESLCASALRQTQRRQMPHQQQSWQAWQAGGQREGGNVALAEHAKNYKRIPWKAQ